VLEAFYVDFVGGFAAEEVDEHGLGYGEGGRDSTFAVGG
jgi:hypothetical protein